MKFRHFVAVAAAVMMVAVFAPASLHAEGASVVLDDAVTTFQDGRYIVDVIDTYPLEDVLADYSITGSDVQLFEHVLYGFAANLTANDALALSRDVRIRSVQENQKVQLAAPLTRTVTSQGL